MKEVAKQIIRAAARVLVSPLYFCFLLQQIISDRRRAFQGYSQALSLLPGRPGEYLRREFYRLTLVHCAPSVIISFGTVFSTDKIALEDNVYIGAYCILGTCRIGQNTMVSSRVSVVSGLRQHGTERLDVPMREQAGTFSEVEIGEDCWLGEGAIVGASVGSQSVVAAGSVVVQSVEPRSVVGGNPAKLLKQRGAISALGDGCETTVRRT